MRILIPDDDDSRHTQFKRNFIDYLLTCVHTSQEAIDHLQNNEYDAVFLDHDLGGKNAKHFTGQHPRTGLLDSE